MRTSGPVWVPWPQIPKSSKMQSSICVPVAVPLMSSTGVAVAVPTVAKVVADGPAPRILIPVTVTTRLPGRTRQVPSGKMISAPPCAVARVAASLSMVTKPDVSSVAPSNVQLYGGKFGRNGACTILGIGIDTIRSRAAWDGMLFGEPPANVVIRVDWVRGVSTIHLSVHYGFQIDNKVGRHHVGRVGFDAQDNGVVRQHRCREYAIDFQHQIGSVKPWCDPFPFLRAAV